MKHFKRIFSPLLIAFIAVTAGIGLYSGLHKAVASDSEAPATPPAMNVEVTEIKPQDIQTWKNFSGHVVAVDFAEIRPQVGGRITEVLFEDGQHVEKGDVLMVIDPRPYEATLHQAQSALQVAITQADLAEKEYQRAKKLIETQAISQGLLDERTNRRGSAAATVAGAKAAVESAQINLDYAHIKAPISGKVSRAEITEGNLVQTGAGAPLLTTVVADEQMYVDFEVDERTYLSSIKSNAQNSDLKTPVRLVLASGDIEYEGFVHSFDNRIDSSSGTIRARAIFENEDKLLLPGMSVSVMMGSVDDQKKILVTERAIGTDQDRKFVYTVNGDNIAKYREVKIGESINGQRIVLSGLKPGEKVISEGIVRIRPGMPVTPQLKSATAAPAEKETMPPPPMPDTSVASEDHDDISGEK